MPGHGTSKNEAKKLSESKAAKKTSTTKAKGIDRARVTKSKTETKSASKVKTLVKHGNSLALVIDKSVLAQLNLDTTTPLRVSVVGSGLRVERADVGLGPHRTKQILGKLRENPKFVEMMQKLAE